MKQLLSNFLTVSVLLSLAALIVLPESILLGTEIFVLLYSLPQGDSGKISLWWKIDFWGTA